MRILSVELAHRMGHRINVNATISRGEFGVWLDPKDWTLTERGDGDRVIYDRAKQAENNNKGRFRLGVGTLKADTQFGAEFLSSLRDYMNDHPEIYRDHCGREGVAQLMDIVSARIAGSVRTARDHGIAEAAAEAVAQWEDVEGSDHALTAAMRKLRDVLKWSRAFKLEEDRVTP